MNLFPFKTLFAALKTKLMSCTQAVMKRQIWTPKTDCLEKKTPSRRQDLYQIGEGMSHRENKRHHVQRHTQKPSKVQCPHQQPRCVHYLSSATTQSILPLVLGIGASCWVQHLLLKDNVTEEKEYNGNRKPAWPYVR